MSDLGAQQDRTMAAFSRKAALQLL